MTRRDTHEHENVFSEQIEETVVFAKESPYPDPDKKLFSGVFKGVATNNK
jgi:TPP-dependent pyruvate/acetoin dehydrogenase alpha subunit